MAKDVRLDGRGKRGAARVSGTDVGKPPTAKPPRRGLREAGEIKRSFPAMIRLGLEDREKKSKLGTD